MALVLALLCLFQLLTAGSSSATAVAYNSALANNSRSVHFPIVARDAPLGTPDFERYEAFRKNLLSRAQQSIEFQAPASSSNTTYMEVSVYIRYYIPTMNTSTDNGTITIWVVSPGSALTDPATVVANRNPYSSIYTDSSEPAFYRTKVLGCDLPGLDVVGGNVCPAAPVLCGVANVPFPTTTAASASSMGKTQFLLASVSSQLLFPKTPAQDGACVNSLEITAIWSDASASGLTLRQAVQYSSNETQIQADLIVPTNVARSESEATQLVAKQFTSGSDPIGTLWTPLIVDDKLRFAVPLGSYHSRFSLSNYSVTSVALVKPVGVSCTVDDSLLLPSQPNGAWSTSCILPTKGALYGALSFRMSESLNTSGWINGLEIVLESTLNTSLAPKRIYCNPIFRAMQDGSSSGCRMYVDCTQNDIFLGAGDMTGQSYTQLRVTWSPLATGFVPPIVADDEAGLSSSACFSSLTVNLVYTVLPSATSTFAPVTCTATTQFLCSNDNVCISNQQVCDGVVDCSDGDDEAGCSSWTLIRTMGTFTLCNDAAPAAAQPYINTYLTCMKYAQANPNTIGGFRYVVDSTPFGNDNSYCQFYHKWCVDSLTADAIATNVSTASSSIRQAVLMLQLSPINQKLVMNATCTPVVSCTSRGSASQMSVSGVGVACVCECYNGFEGSDCSLTKPYYIGRTVVFQVFGLSTTINAKMLLAIQRQVPAAGDLWVYSASYDITTNTTQLIMGAGDPTVVVLPSAEARLLQNIPNFRNVTVGSDIPVVLTGDLTTCTVDDVVGTTHCTYYRKNTSRAETIDVMLTSYSPIAVSTIDVTAYDVNGTIMLQKTCSVLEMLNTPDLSYDFLVLQNGGMLVDSWCPSQYSCLLGSLSGSVAAFSMSFTLPAGRNSTTLSVLCNGVDRFASGSETLLPKILIVPTPPTGHVNAATEVYGITPSSTLPALASFVALLGIAVTCFALFCFCRRKDHYLLELSQSVAQSKLAMKRLGLNPGETISQTYTWSVRVVAKSERGSDIVWYLQPRRHVAIWITLTALFFSVAVLAVVYYGNATPTNSSNYDVVMRFFHDESCNVSLATPFPFAALVVPASGDCSDGELIGKAFQYLPAHFAMTCGTSGTTAANANRVTLRYGDGKTVLCPSESLTLTTDVCTPVAFKPSSGSAVITHLMVSCSDGVSVSEFKSMMSNYLPINIYGDAESIRVTLTQAAADGLTSSSASADTALTGQQVPPFSNANPFIITDPVTKVTLQQFYYYDTSSPEMQYSSSTNEYMVSYAVGDSNTVVGPSTVPKELLVSQTAADMLSNTLVSDIQAYEASIRDADRYLPRTSQGDVPVGRFFNGYGTYIDWTNATQNVDNVIYERLFYPGIMGQDLDIGGGNEATIAFWMRAGPNSRGFPVVGADYWRLNSNDQSPLLDRLERMILSNNMDVNAWYGEDWSVYWAIYVDGFSKRIYFVSAGPKGHPYVGFNDNEVFSSVWDAASLGVERIFTNRWHHIAITIEAPANADQSGMNSAGLVLRLTVDGQTFSGNQGFLQCLPRQIEAITPLWTPRIAVSQDSVVVQGGTLIVGSINAGLYGVLVTSSAYAQTDIIALGTIPMNNFFSVNSPQFFALGFYVTFMATALFFMMLIGVIAESISERRKAIASEALSMEMAYTSITGVALHAEKLHIGNKDFKALPVKIVQQIIGLDSNIFTTLLGELLKLAGSQDAAKADLLAVVWSRGQLTYVPSTTQLSVLQQQYQNAEKSDLSRDGQFLIPTALWSDFVEQQIAYWKEQNGDENVEEDDKKKRGVVAGKLQVKINKVKIKVGKSAGKGGKAGKGASVRKLTNNIKLNAVAPIQMIMPMILAIQSAAVYLKNFAVPLQYQVVFAQVFQYFSLVIVSIPNLPSLFFAVMQFVGAIGITLILIYYCVSDHDEWLAFVGAYAAKRDALDKDRVRDASMPPKPRSQRKALLVALGDDDELDDDYLFSDKYVGTAGSMDQTKNEESSSSGDDEDENQTPRTQPIDDRKNWYESMLRYVLPLRLTIHMDEFIDKSRRSNIIHAHRKDLVPAVCPKKRYLWEMDYDGDSGRYVLHDGHNRSAPPLPLMDVGYVCPLHRSILCEMEQRDTCVKPYQCFVVQGGVRCNTVEGMMYCCRSLLPDGRRCPYSLCMTHMRMSAIDFIKVSAKTGLMEIFGEGLPAFLAFVAISLSSVIYFPVVQTCLQFLVCDPQYQCVFPHCWSDADATFILAASVVILVLGFVGAGMPLVMFWELNRRKNVLFALFHRKEYYKIYLATDEDAMEELEEQEEQARRSMFSSDKQDPTDAAGVFGFFAKFFSKSITGETIEEEIMEKVSVVKKNTVDFGEWERFLSGDNSAMQMLYRFLEYEYLVLPPFLMLYRVAVLLPSIFVTDNLFLQMTASAIVEVGFGTFIFWTEPYVNPWIDTMYRAGSVHNIMLIGLGAMNIMLTANNSSLDLTNLMLAVTGVYFMFVVGLIVMTTVWPTLSIALTQVRVASQMKNIGMRTIDMSSLFLNPFLHTRVLCKIVNVYQEYEGFVKAHPDLKPGDDINSKRDADDDQLPGGEGARQVAAQGSDTREGANVNNKADFVVEVPVKGGSPQGKSNVVGNGLLGALAGVPSPDPRLTREEIEEQAQQQKKQTKAPRTLFDEVVDVVSGTNPADPELELHDSAAFDDE